MLKIYSFVLLFIPIAVCAQKFAHEFVGTLQLPEGQEILYKIRFNQTENNLILGESVSDYLGANSTTSIIKGSINEKENTISFWETANTSTASKANEADFCFVNAHEIALSSAKQNGIIMGSFTGLYPNGESCVNGSIFMVGEKYYQDQYLPGTSLDSLKKKYAGQPNLLQHFLKDKMVLTNNEVMKVSWQSSEIRLMVWDNSAIDYDVIDVFVNDSLVYDDIALRGDKQSLLIDFPSDYCEIKVCAVSEGSINLNTLHAVIVDKHAMFPLLSSLKKGECVSVQLAK